MGTYFHFLFIYPMYAHLSVKRGLPGMSPSEKVKVTFNRQEHIVWVSSRGKHSFILCSLSPSPFFSFTKSTKVLIALTYLKRRQCCG